MTAAYYAITLEQGETWRPVLTVTDDTGAPVDLTGYIARMQVRESTESPAPLLDLAVGDGIAIDGPAGRISLRLEAAVTAAITWTHAVYDLEIVSPGGDVTRLLKGEVLVGREVTR